MYCCRAAALLASITWSLDPFEGLLFDFLWLILFCGIALCRSGIKKGFVLGVKQRGKKALRRQLQKEDSEESHAQLAHGARASRWPL